MFKENELGTTFTLSEVMKALEMDTEKGMHVFYSSVLTYQNLIPLNNSKTAEEEVVQNTKETWMKIADALAAYIMLDEKSFDDEKTYKNLVEMYFTYKRKEPERAILFKKQILQAFRFASDALLSIERADELQ